MKASPVALRMKITAWTLSFSIFSAVCFWGCRTQPPQPLPIQTIAVLPFDNESNDINADDIMQQMVHSALKEGSSYQVLDLKEVNSKLQQNGITEGGQLTAADPIKIGQDLGAQALLYGVVENFDYTNIGIYLRKRVLIGLKMVSASTGEVLWENKGQGILQELGLNRDEITRNFFKGLVDRSVEKLFKVPLQQEARTAVIQALRTLPGWRVVNCF